MIVKTLADLKAGRKARVTSIAAVSEAARCVMEMGITAGVVVEVCHVAPLGDPIAIKVRGYRLSLRKGQAGIVEIEEGA